MIALTGRQLAMLGALAARGLLACVLEQLLFADQIDDMEVWRATRLALRVPA